jgi:hypothetical protein
MTTNTTAVNDAHIPWSYIVKLVDDKLVACRDALEIAKDIEKVRELQWRISIYKEILAIPDQLKAKADMAG